MTIKTKDITSKKKTFKQDSHGRKYKCIVENNTARACHHDEPKFFIIFLKDSNRYECYPK